MKTISNIFTATATINFVSGNIITFNNKVDNRAWDNGTGKGFHNLGGTGM